MRRSSFDGARLAERPERRSRDPRLAQHGCHSTAARSVASPDSDSKADRLTASVARRPQDIAILAKPDPISRRQRQAFSAAGDRPREVGSSAAIRVTRHPAVVVPLPPLETEE